MNLGLELLSLSLRNFYSIGNATQSVNFNNTNTNLILGENIDYGEDIRNGVGKAQPLYSKVKVPNGWKTIGDIHIGDIVSAPEGTNAVVTGVYPQGNKDIYEIKTVDGRSTHACLNHLWEVIISDETKVIDTKQIIQLINSGYEVKLPLLDYTIENDYNGLDPDFGKLFTDIHYFDDFNNNVYDKLSYEQRKLLFEFIKEHKTCINNEIILDTIDQAKFVCKLIWSLGGITKEEIFAQYNSLENTTSSSFNIKYVFKSEKIKGVKIKSVKHLGTHECQCIKLSSERQVYITDNYLVTHNTTILNGISYALTGKPITKSKQDSLVNYVNKKHMVIRLDFKVDGQHYYIERGRKPNILKLIKVTDDTEDDIMEGMGENADTDKEIAKLINLSPILMKYVLLMSTYSEPFMSCSAQQQRTIIEELIRITTLSEKAQKTSEREKDVKHEIEKEKIRISTLEDSNKRIEESYKSIEQSLTKWTTTHKHNVSQIIETIRTLESIDIETEIKYHNENKESNEIKNLCQLVETDLKSKERELTLHLSNINKLNEELTILDNPSTCPTCKQKITSDDIIDHKNKLVSQIDGVLQTFERLDKEVNDTKTELSNIPEVTIHETTYRNINDALKHDNELTSLRNRLNELESETNPYEEQLQLFDDNKQEVDYSTLISLEKELKHLKFIKKLLTDRESFLRKNIIEQNIPYLNQRLGEHLPKLGLPHVISFDPNLTFNITYLGIDVDYNNLSRGEQNRLTFALNLAFRDVYEHNTGKINCIFVDELLDFGIDTKGAKDGLEILKEYSRNDNKCTYLVTHKDELIESVDSIIKVRKENDFTTYSYEEFDNQP